MVIAIILWTLIVGGLWWAGGAALALLTPGAAWLQANPDLAAWIEPALGFFASLGPVAAGSIWLAGVALIALIGWPARKRRARAALSYDEWRQLDGGASYAPRGAEGFRPPPSGDEYHRGRTWRRRRRRDDDDDDDDDD